MRLARRGRLGGTQGRARKPRLSRAQQRPVAKVQLSCNSACNPQHYVYWSVLEVTRLPVLYLEFGQFAGKTGDGRLS